MFLLPIIQNHTVACISSVDLGALVFSRMENGERIDRVEYLFAHSSFCYKRTVCSLEQKRKYSSVVSLVILNLCLNSNLFVIMLTDCDYIQFKLTYILGCIKNLGCIIFILWQQYNMAILYCYNMAILYCYNMAILYCYNMTIL